MDLDFPSYRAKNDLFLSKKKNYSNDTLIFKFTILISFVRSANVISCAPKFVGISPNSGDKSEFYICKWINLNGSVIYDTYSHAENDCNSYVNDHLVGFNLNLINNDAKFSMEKAYLNSAACGK